MRAADLLLSRADEFGRVETLDNGKPIFEAAKIDMPAAAECLSYFGEYADKLYGDTFPGRTDAFLLTLREPVGVVGAITPWNFPLLQAMWKIAPALALGNTVVLKPASATPLTALLLRRAAARRRACRRARSTSIPGPGAVIGQAMAEHPGIDKISFTGETETGKSILRAAAGHRQARLDGARRQVAEHRLRRRRPRRRRPGRDQRDLLRQGRALLGRVAPARRGVGPRRAHGEGRRPREEDGARRPARPEDAPRAPSSPRSSARTSRATSRAARRKARSSSPAATPPPSTARAPSSRPTVFDGVTPRDDDRARRDLRPGPRRHRPSRTRRRPSRSATPRSTGSPRRSGRATSRRRSARRRRSRPARSGSTPTTSTTRACPSAATSSPASAASAATTRSRSTRRSRASGWT